MNTQSRQHIAAVIALAAWGVFDACVGLWRADPGDRLPIDLLLGPVLLIAWGWPLLTLRSTLHERVAHSSRNLVITSAADGLACAIPTVFIENVAMVPTWATWPFFALLAGAASCASYLMRDAASPRRGQALAWLVLATAVVLNLTIDWQAKPWLQVSIGLFSCVAAIEVLRAKLPAMPARQLAVLWIFSLGAALTLWASSMQLRWFVSTYTAQQSLFARPLSNLPTAPPYSGPEADLEAQILGDVPTCSPAATRVAHGEVDIVFIGVDAWRADYTSAMPRTAAALGNAVEFERAVAPAPRTIFSLAAMTRGRHVRDVPFDGGVGSEAPATVADALAAHGYRSVFVPSHRYLHEDVGVARGFEHHYPRDFERVQRREGLYRGFLPASEVLTAAREVSAASPGPLLLWTHLMEAHFPYRHDDGQGPASPEGYRHALVDLDAKLADFVQHMQATRPRPIVWVFFGDHGEAFGRRGMYRHSGSLFDDQIHVAAWLSLPGQAARRIDAPMSTASLTTTVADFATGTVPCGSTAPSMLQCIRGGPCPNIAVSELLPFGSHLNHLVAYTLREGRFVINPDARAHTWIPNAQAVMPGPTVSR